MPQRVQSLRSSTKLQRPAQNTREVGELYVNFPDLQLGVIDPAKNPIDLLAIRFFSTTTDYVAGNFVVQAGKAYQAKGAVPAGAFNATQWDAVLTGATAEPPIAAGTVNDYWRGDKAWRVLDKNAVGLSNVDNTSDANKPTSNATQAALALKAPIDSPLFTGSPQGPTPAPGTANTQLATTAFVDTELTAVEATIALKANIDSPTFTGDPKAPTPLVSDNDTSIATTAYVKANLEAIAAGSVTPAGTVSFMARNTPPNGWLKANGAEVSRTSYAELFLAIGTLWGAGDGLNTFLLPDLRGEFIRAWDDSRGVDPGRVFGSMQMDGIRGHTHAFSATSGTVSVNHTHLVSGGTGGRSAAHTHAISGTTSGESVTHTHTFSDASSATGGVSANHTHATNITTGTSGTGIHSKGDSFASSGMISTGSNSVGHTHTVAVSGTTGGRSVSHTHTFADTSGTESVDHSHTMSFQTGNISANHTHTVSGTSGLNDLNTADTRPRNTALLACIKY